jgi:hypothetical protein
MTVTHTDGPLVHDELLGIDVLPVQLVQRMVGGATLARAIYAVCKLDVPRRCAAEPQTPEALAAATGADAETMRRYLRLLGGAGLVHEHDDGTFQLTALGELLRPDVPGSLGPLAILAAEVLEPSPSAALFSARTGRAAFHHDHGCGLYDHLAAHPELEQLFADVMTARAVHLHAEVIDAIDWSDVTHVVDVGGSHGALLAAILRRLPHATGVLLDQPQVVAGAGPALDAAGVADRVDVEAGDFFAAVPPGGDFYLLANVIWNWSDDEAVQILRRCREAMAATVRLVACEPVVPCGNRFHPAKVLDVANLWLNGGRTRSIDEWRRLLVRSGLELIGVTETRLEWSVVEARPGPA